MLSSQAPAAAAPVSRRMARGVRVHRHGHRRGYLHHDAVRAPTCRRAASCWRFGSSAAQCRSRARCASPRWRPLSRRRRRLLLSAPGVRRRRRVFVRLVALRRDPPGRWRCSHSRSATTRLVPRALRSGATTTMVDYLSPVYWLFLPALLVLRRRYPDTPRPSRVPGYLGAAVHREQPYGRGTCARGLAGVVVLGAGVRCALRFRARTRR